MAAGAPIFLPVGATEQHGRHMALTINVVIPTAICERVARSAGGLVAPTLAYATRSQPRTGGGPSFPGTLNLSAGTFALVVRDVVCELYAKTSIGTVVANGHYENIGPCIEGIELALDAIGRDRASDLTVLRFVHWEFVRPETLERIFPDGYPGIEVEHASVLDTSLMLALRPDLVDLSQAIHDGPARFRPYDRYPHPASAVRPSGVLSLSEGSSAEKGEWLLTDVTTRMAKYVNEELDQDSRP